LSREREASRVAGQTEHLRRAAELYREFAALRQEFPGVSPGQLIERFTPADRGSVLDSLLLAGSNPSASATLWAVAGPYLVRMTLSDDEIPPQLIALPPTLGPLRSVRPAELDGKPALLAGARAGVFAIDASRPDSAVGSLDPDLTSELGFNSAVVLEEAGTLVAGHTDGGVVTWTLGAPDRPSTMRRELGRPTMKSGPKYLAAIDGKNVALAVGSEIAIVGSGDDRLLPIASPSPVVAILPTEVQLIVVHEDGTIFTVDRSTREVGEKSAFPGRYTAATSVPFLGVGRLLLGCEEGSAECVSLDDALLTRYASPHRGFRALSATADWVAGVTADRQRLVLWRTWNPAKPVREIHLAALTRHRIADISFGR
jgi:hypothetical protein